MRANRSIIGVAAVALVLGCALAGPAWAVYDPGKIQAHATYAELAQTPVQVEGGWEYIVDFYINGGGTYRYGIWGPETMYENMTNIDYGATWAWGTQNIVMQYWDHNAADATNVLAFKPPSVGIDGEDAWQLPSDAWEGLPEYDFDWAMLNTWHAPSEYLYTSENYHTTLVDGKDAGDVWLWGSLLGQDLLQVMNTGPSSNRDPGLFFTVRIVSSEILPSLEWSSPNDSPIPVDWDASVWLDHPDYVPGLGVDFDHNGTNDVSQNTYGVYPIVGNFDVGPPLGDFDDSMHVDNVDIDLLCDAIYAGLSEPEDLALYDISADGLTEGTDGVIDTKDLDFLIRFLVETLLGPGMEGTEYGDFNLDGVIDTTDLTRLATNYGAANWKWDDGNANRYIDTDIDNTDLTILATYYGFGEPDVVPEPATLSLLVLGASGLLARRRRQA